MDSVTGGGGRKLAPEEHGTVSPNATRSSEYTKGGKGEGGHGEPGGTRPERFDVRGRC